MTRLSHALSFALTTALVTPALAEDRAVVIGIDDYTSLAQPLALGSAVADARAFAGFLTDEAGFAPASVTVLTDADASSDRILTAVIDELLGMTAPGDRAVLYFAGLGTTALSGGAPVPALVAYDGDGPLGRIPADLFTELFAQFSDRDVTLVIDAGFSGVAAPPAGVVARGLDSDAGPVADYAAFGAGDGRQIWVAASPGQPAWESANGGVFTGVLLEGVRGLAERDGDGIVSNGELIAHALSRSEQWCASSAPCTAVGLAPVHTGPAAAPAFIPSHLLPQAQEVEVEGAPTTYAEMLGFVVDLFAPSNPAGLELGIDGPQPLAIGSQVQFHVSSQTAGALILLDIDPEGHLIQIFPSALAPAEGRDIAAGERINIPSGMSANGLPLRVNVTGPEGQGILLALFTEGDADTLAGVLPAGLATGALPDAGQHLYQIAQDLLRRDADPATSLNWSAAYFPYEITP